MIASKTDYRSARTLGDSHFRIFVDQLADMRDAEKQLVRALAIIAGAAKAKDLQEVVTVHLGETRGHAKTFEEIAETLGIKLPRKTCKAMRGWSRDMELTRETAFLTSILGQEKMADTLLTGVAKGSLPLGELIQRVSLKKIRGTKPVSVRKRGTFEPTNRRRLI